MGFLAALRPGIGSADLTAAAALLAPAQTGIASPWAPPSHLASVVWSDIFGKQPAVLTRAEAMRVPAVARSRHIICSTIARDPMHFYRDGDPIEGPSWLTSTAGTTSAFHRDTWTADDLLFYGWSLWRRVRNTAPDPTGRVFPLEVARVEMGQWHLETDTGRVLIYKPDGRGGVSLQPAHGAEVILIPGPHEGLLVDGAESVRHAADLQRAAHQTARHPSAYLGLKQTSGTPLKKRSDDPEEVTVETILADWRAARNNPEGGGVAWLGGVEPHEFGTFDAHLVTEGRNAAAVDVARHASIPADLIDATIEGASLQYTTSRDNDRRAIDYGIGFYMGAISARLSLDDVCPRGQRVAFELEEWLKTETPAPGQPAASPAPSHVPPTPETAP